MSTLFDYQKTHTKNLIKILKTHKKALDVSKTGSGKSITSLHVYKEIFRESALPLVVVCPPTLVPSWKKHCSHELTDISNIHIYSSYQLVKIKKPSGFLIIDECHDFKNAVKRTRLLKKIIDKAQFVLCMSATPIDDIRQEVSLQSLIGNNINEKTSKMTFDYKTKISISLDYFAIDNESHKEYLNGYNYIRLAAKGVQHADHFERFVPEFFTTGLRVIHSVLFPYMINYLQSELQSSSKKFVVVMRYKEQFEELKDIYPDVLVLNGSTPSKQREDIIRSFQEDSSKRIIAISELVGGIGIELDDKVGNSPREIIMLPTSNGVNFTQIIGRVQRTNTQSNSTVRIIQPNRKKTYFKNQMKRKQQILNQFNELPVFKEKTHCVCDNRYEYLERFLNKDIISEIHNFLCECYNK